MGIKKLDRFETDIESAIVLIEEGKTDDVIKIIKTFKHQIKEEKKLVAGNENTWYFYRCKGCSLGCEEKHRFEPKEKHLKYCKLDGSLEADYIQYDSRTNVNYPNAKAVG